MVRGVQVHRLCTFLKQAHICMQKVSTLSYSVKGFELLQPRS